MSADALLVYAIPMFFVLMGLEIVFGFVHRKPNYHFADSITNIGCGIGYVALNIISKSAQIAVYILIYNAYRLFNWPHNHWLVWVIAIVGVDFCYYVFHRSTHRVNILWAAHMVHHQSEEMNLSVALRQSWFSQFFSWVFYTPLALLGISPLMMILSRVINLLYGFCVHTRFIKSLWPLDLLFVSPAHHRVHHAVNENYLDRNFGGIFIIWDRLCGTFKDENKEPTYGTVKPLRSMNPLWANFQYLFELAKISLKFSDPMDRIKLWFKPPGWHPGEKTEFGPEYALALESREKFTCPVSFQQLIYIFIHFISISIFITWLLSAHANLGIHTALLAIGFIMMSLLSFGALMESKRWSIAIESLRCIFLILFLVLLM